MCGVTGYFGPYPQDKRNLVDDMRKAIIHRGPDHSVLTMSDNYCIGFNRLAINGLTEAGNQPFTHDGVTIFCNGEIYNHKELKKKFGLEEICHSGSDIEIIPYLYRKLGMDFLQELNAMFAMVILDEKKGALHLVTDRFGKKPLYTYQANGGLFFSSELKSFLLHFDCEVDKKSLSIGFFLGYFPYPLTPVKNIEKISPATILTFKGGSISKRNWYVLQPNYEINKYSDQDCQVLYRELLDDAVRIRMEADVEVGTFLSGGMDSTSVADSAVRQGYQKIHAFCGIIDGKGYSTDNINSERFAQENGLNLHHIAINAQTYDRLIVRTCSAFDEIPFETGNLNFLAISENAKKHVKVLLDGIGGDEVFLGYPHQLILHRLPKIFREIFPYNRNLLNFLRKRNRKFYAIAHALMDIRKWFFFIRSFIPPAMMHKSQYFDIDYLEDTLDSLVVPYSKGFGKSKDISLPSYLDILGYDMNNYQHTDRMAMAYSIESRSPLSDYRIWENFMGLDENKKLEHGLKSFMKKFSNLPDYITQANKDGFSTPLYQWFLKDKELLGNMLKIVQDNVDLLENLLGDGLVEAIIKNWRDLSKITWADGTRLHTLVSVVLWYKIYFEDKSLFNKNVSLSTIAQCV